jgi:hypothetical protein
VGFDPARQNGIICSWLGDRATGFTDGEIVQLQRIGNISLCWASGLTRLHPPQHDFAQPKDCLLRYCSPPAILQQHNVSQRDCSAAFEARCAE